MSLQIDVLTDTYIPCTSITQPNIIDGKDTQQNLSNEQLLCQLLGLNFNNLHIFPTQIPIFNTAENADELVRAVGQW